MYVKGKIKDFFCWQKYFYAEHHLYAGLSTLRSGDELRAIPITNEIVRIIPKNWLFRQLLKNNGI